MHALLSRAARRGAVVVVALLASCVLAVVSPLGGRARLACAAGPSAAEVVRFAQDSEKSFCVPTTAAGISGIAALKATKLPVLTKDFGGSLGEAVCKIGDVGDDLDKCSGPAETGFWSYYLRGTNEVKWDFSQVGPSARMLKPGDVDGWTWTPAPGAGGPPPDTAPDYSKICATASASGTSARKAARSNPASSGLPEPARLGLAAAAGAVVAFAAGRLSVRRKT